MHLSSHKENYIYNEIKVVINLNFVDGFFDMSYESDWSHIGRTVALASLVGAGVGWVYGVSRASGAKGALLASVQSAVFAGSFFVVREGYRHALRVRSWNEDWMAVNVLSSGTGAAFVGSIRSKWSRLVFVKSFLGGSMAGMAGSIVYLVFDRMYLGDGVGKMSDLVPSMPSWSPFRRISQEEVKERREKY